MANAMAPDLNATMVGVGRLVDRFEHILWWLGKETLDLSVDKRPVGLERKQIVAATRDDLIGNGCLGAHRVDCDKRSSQFRRSSSSGMAVISLDLMSVAS